MIYPNVLPNIFAIDYIEYFQLNFCKIVGQHSIQKYSWTPVCDIQFENTPGLPHVTVN